MGCFIVISFHILSKRGFPNTLQSLLEMQLPVLLLLLPSLTFATPITSRRAAASTGSSAAVLTPQTYNELSISGGTSGNALAETNAKFPIDMNNLAGVAESDLNIINSASQIGEDAETEAFDPAITAAGGADKAVALQNGKIKNKVFKC